jgi:hypothetical protein
VKFSDSTAGQKTAIFDVTTARVQFYVYHTVLLVNMIKLIFKLRNIYSCIKIEFSDTLNSITTSPHKVPQNNSDFVAGYSHTHFTNCYRFSIRLHSLAEKWLNCELDDWGLVFRFRTGGRGPTRHLVFSWGKLANELIWPLISISADVKNAWSSTSTLPHTFIACTGSTLPPFYFSGEGPCSRRYGRTAALMLLVQPCDEDDNDDDYYFLSFS